VLRGEFDLAEVRVECGEQVGQTGEGVIAKSVLSGVNLSETVYAPMELSTVVFEDVELSNAAWRLDVGKDYGAGPSPCG
jgi:hypothetical protein